MAETVSDFDQARCFAVLEFPFFASMILHIPEVAMDDAQLHAMTGMTPTAAVTSVKQPDGSYREQLLYSRQYVRSLSEPEKIFVMAHEVMHVALGHVYPWRRGNRDPLRWNIAGDYVINLILKDAHMSLPKGVLVDEKFRGMCAEEVYEKLPEALTLKCKCYVEGGDGADGHGDKDGRGAEWTRGQEERWRGILQSARQCGSVPGGMERYIEEACAPKMPWYAVLRQYASEILQIDYNWNVPDQRWLSGTALSDGTHTAPVYLPDLWDERIRAAVYVDTSGSMSDDDLGICLAEIDSLLKTFGIIDLRIMAGDTCVEFDKTYKAGMKVPRSLGRGGGGTSFVPLFEQLEKEAEKPRILIVMTDMCATYPTFTPSFPVIFMNIMPNNQTRAPFGRTIDWDRHDVKKAS